MDHPRLQRAMLLYGQSRHELAEGELRQFLAEAPNDAFGHALLARVLAEGERYEEATLAAMQAIHLAPDDAFAHQSLGVVMVRRHRYREAEQAVQEAIALDPYSADSHALMSQIHFAERRWRDALTAAELGLSIDAEDSTCANLRAMALVKLGRRDEAQAIIQTTLAQDPEDALSHVNQGWTLLHQRQPDKALVHFREALRLDPSYEGARQGIVEALKARNIVYRAMLGWFLWMNRLNRRAQWAIIIGGFIGYQVLGGVADANPKLAPFVQPLLIAYMVFAVMTWVATPLSNLLLRFNRFGRLALHREQIIISNYVGGCVLGAILFLLAALIFQERLLLRGALYFGMLIPIVACVFHCDLGWPRTSILAIVLALAFLGGASVGVTIVYLTIPSSEPALLWYTDHCGAALFLLFLVLALIAQFAANFLMTAVVRR